MSKNLTSNNSGRPDRTRQASVALLVLLAAMGLEIAYYPRISSWIFEVATGRGWDGSALRYFQMFYVLPGGLMLAVALSVSVLWTLRREPSKSRRVLIAAWVTNLVALALSVVWYAKGTHT